MENRSLDAWIAEHIFDFAWTPPIKDNRRYLMPPEEWQRYKPEFIKRGLNPDDHIVAEKRVPYYTTDDAAAFLVLQQCASKTTIVIYQGEHSKKWHVENEPDFSDSPVFVAFAETLPLAICKWAKDYFTYAKTQRGA